MNDSLDIDLILLQKDLPSDKVDGIKLKTTSIQRHFSYWKRSKKRFIFYLAILSTLAILVWWFTDDGLKLIRRNEKLIKLNKEILNLKEQVNLKEDDIQESRYLSYLPHSGFHNQRISLENALTLAKVLNRTLIIPPCLLGTAIPWIEYDKLLNRLRSISTIGFQDCNLQVTTRLDISSRECLSQIQITWFDWNQLINLEEIQKSVKFIKRESFESKWLIKKLKINQPKDQILQIKEHELYQYRFSLIGKKKTQIQLGKFNESLDVYKLLGNSNAKLIELGSVFGSSRLKFYNDPIGKQARSNFRRAMVFNNPILIELSKQISSQFKHPSGFLAIHIRVGDNKFRSQATQSVYSIMMKLVTNHLKLTISSFNQTILENYQKNINYQNFKLNLKNKESLPCRREKHTKSNLLELNRPLFVATDSPLPEVEPALDIIFKLFPCTYLLQDFELDLLKKIKPFPNVNSNLNQKIDNLMLPFLDAMIAARASYILGTPGSTFSTFTTDILFPSYHNLSIIEVG